MMPDWNAERARLKARFAAGEIGASTREELERYLLVLVCSTSPDSLQNQHDLENEAFAPVIKKLLETRIADEHHAKDHHLNVQAYKLSFSAFWVSVGSAIAAVSAAISAAIQAHYAAQPPTVDKYSPPPAAQIGQPATLSQPASESKPFVAAQVPWSTNSSGGAR